MRGRPTVGKTLRAAYANAHTPPFAGCTLVCHRTLASAEKNPMKFRQSFLAVIAALSATVALGAESGQQPRSDATYQKDRAACMDGRTNQDRDTCLREAGAARQEAKRGQLTESPEHYEQNRFARCEKQPPQDRDDCIRRMKGEGTTSGSVESGGIYRELVRPVATPKPE
jgi:hypothetical protein